MRMIFFLCRFFSLDKEKKRRKKRNSTGVMAIADESLTLGKVLWACTLSFKKGCELPMDSYVYPAFFPCSSINSLSATSAMNSPLVGLSFLP